MRRSFGLAVFVALFSAAAAAQPPPPPCPDDEEVRFEGDTGDTGPNGIPFSINLAPCQQLEITIEATPSNHVYSAYMKAEVFNNTGQTLFVDQRAATTPQTLLLPPAVEPWIPRSRPEYYGTRGAPGLPFSGKFVVDVIWSGDKVQYKFLMKKSRRRPPDGSDRVYNEGGTSFANAPLVPLGTHYFGALSIMEVPSALLTKDGGQYFKVRLEPSESMYFIGELLGEGGLYRPGVDIYIWDPTKADPVRWWYTLVDCGSQPTGQTCLKTVDTSDQPFANPYPVATEFYVSIRSRWEYLHHFRLGLYKYVKRLTLFLDADNTFNPQDPASDVDWYTPCSTREGASEMAQNLRVFAGYRLDGKKALVAPPGPGDAVFSLRDTSAFFGVAMNRGDRAGDPDFVLPYASTTEGDPYRNKVKVPFLADNTAWTWLQCLDYGGFTTVSVERSTDTADMAVPKDDDHNWISDAGWYAAGVHIDDPGAPSTVDTDGTPAATVYPTRTWGLVGDGLTAYEEYRGFMIDGAHTRMNPQKKDVFTTYDPVWRVGYAGNLRQHGFALHEIKGAVYGFGVMEHDDAGVVNWSRWNDGAGGPIPGTDGTFTPQKALRITIVNQYIPGYFGFTKPLEVDPKVPLDVSDIEIWVASTMALAHPQDYQLILGPNAPGPYTTEQAENEVRRTFAHEIGHGIAICHPGGCTPHGISEAGRPPSVMGGTAGGPPATDPLSMYSDFEIGVARLHKRF
jgi:hypothetical protein